MNLIEILSSHHQKAKRRRAMSKNFLSYLLLAAGISFLISYAGSQSAAAADGSTVPAYVGCTFAWDYPEDQAHLVQSFGIHVDGKPGSIALGKAARSYPCDSIANGFGPQLWKIRAWSKELGHSKFAEIMVDYQEKPEFAAPTGISIILEWKPFQENE